VLVWSASVIVAFWVGTHWAASSPVVAPARVVVPPPISVTASGGLTAAQVRDIIREELARVPAPAADDEPRDPVADEARSSEVAQRLAEAKVVVEDGIRDGIWSNQDRAKLRQYLAHLGPAETQELLRPLFQAINNQRLKLDGPPI